MLNVRTMKWMTDNCHILHRTDPPRLDPAIADRILIARLSLDPSGGDSGDDDPQSLTVLASLDENETSWDWLISCWKRCEKEKAKARKVSV